MPEQLTTEQPQAFTRWRDGDGQELVALPVGALAALLDDTTELSAFAQILLQRHHELLLMVAKRTPGLPAEMQAAARNGRPLDSAEARDELKEQLRIAAAAWGEAGIHPAKIANAGAVMADPIGQLELVRAHPDGDGVIRVTLDELVTVIEGYAEREIAEGRG